MYNKLKKNKPKTNKLSKKKSSFKSKTGSSFNFLHFVQHNIGQVEYNIKNKLYNSYGSEIKNKTHSLDPFRDFQYYYYSDDLNNMIDIYFLQEVQYGDVNFTNKDYQYYINYVVTGHIDSCDEKESSENLKKINHGCLIAFNQKKFNILKGLETMNVFERGFKYRTSNWLILEEINSKEKFGIISVHGPILSPVNNDKLNVIKAFYNNILDCIEEINNNFNDINYIISGDFNINLLNPNFNPFSEKRTPEEIIIIEEYSRTLFNFISKIHKLNIDIYKLDQDTAYGKNFKEKLDFVLLSGNLLNNCKIQIKDTTVKPMKNNNNLELGDAEFLINDFDHCKFIGDINLKKKTKKVKNLPNNLNNLSLKPSIQTTSWVGSGYDLLYGFVYLAQKHNNFSFIYFKTSDYSDIMWDLTIHLKCNHINKLTLFLPGNKSNLFIDKIKKASRDYKNNKNKIKFILIPIYIGTTDCRVDKGHFNTLIFNLETNIIERFEPYGNIVSGHTSRLFDRELKNFFRINKLNITLHSPYDFMKDISFQHKDEDEITNYISSLRPGDPMGFCGVWGLWFSNIRLKFPDVSTKELINKAFKLINDKYKFRKFIRNYSYFLIEERNKMIGKGKNKYNIDKKIKKLIL